VLSGNTPTYAAIPADSIRKAIKEVPQNVGLLARMAVGKLAKAAEGKGNMLQVLTSCFFFHRLCQEEEVCQMQHRILCIYLSKYCKAYVYIVKYK